MLNSILSAQIAAPQMIIRLAIAVYIQRTILEMQPHFFFVLDSILQATYICYNINVNILCGYQIFLLTFGKQYCSVPLSELLDVRNSTIIQFTRYQFFNIFWRRLLFL